MKHILHALGAMTCLLLAGCATQALHPPAWASTSTTPHQVAVTPERFSGARVIWGGKIIHLQNKADHTEVEILAFPLDQAQRPVPDNVGLGRFIAVLPGYVESVSYPRGGWVTLRGSIKGVRSARVGQAAYVFPLVDVLAAHLWSNDAMRQRSNVRFNIGIGIGIH